MDIVLPLLTLVIGLLAGGLAMLLWTRRAADPGEESAHLKVGLERLHESLLDLGARNASWQGQLAQQVTEVRDSADGLRRETADLTTALRKPQVRGRWGEMHLRRTVELAGLVDHCDFTVQVSTRSGDVGLRPDLVVHLAGGGNVVVDAKAPLEAYLDAVGTHDPDEHAAHMARHARQLRTHVDQLASKSYWRALPMTPAFVVLFLPAESFLGAALEADRDLLEHAASKHVVLATPTTLIALLRTVSHGWQQHTLAQETQRIHDLGREVHDRLATMAGHLQRLGRSLTGSVDAYNSAIGSLESRVLVTARQFHSIFPDDKAVPRPAPVDHTSRPLTAPELLEALTPQRDELLDGPMPTTPADHRRAI